MIYEIINTLYINVTQHECLSSFTFSFKQIKKCTRKNYQLLSVLIKKNESRNNKKMGSFRMKMFGEFLWDEIEEISLLFVILFSFIFQIINYNLFCFSFVVIFLFKFFITSIDWPKRDFAITNLLQVLFNFC